MGWLNSANKPIASVSKSVPCASVASIPMALSGLR